MTGSARDRHLIDATWTVVVHSRPGLKTVWSASKAQSPRLFRVTRGSRRHSPAPGPAKCGSAGFELVLSGGALAASVAVDVADVLPAGRSKCCH